MTHKSIGRDERFRYAISIVAVSLFSSLFVTYDQIKMQLALRTTALDHADHK